MEQAENSCQIYLIVPASLDRQHVDALMATDALSAGACILLRHDADGQINEDMAGLLRDAAHAADKPLLIEGDASLAQKLEADGVHVDADEDAYDNDRSLLGDDRIIGVDCGSSRHLAMTLAERGADYVAFSGGNTDELSEVISWWTQVTVVPCVAWDAADLETAERMAEAGADVVSFDNFVWSHANGPAAALREISDRLAGNRAAA